MMTSKRTAYRCICFCFSIPLAKKVFLHENACKVDTVTISKIYDDYTPKVL
jgi:hypothetical protein